MKCDWQYVPRLRSIIHFCGFTQCSSFSWHDFNRIGTNQLNCSIYNLQRKVDGQSPVDIEEYNELKRVATPPKGKKRWDDGQDSYEGGGVVRRRIIVTKRRSVKTASPASSAGSEESDELSISNDVEMEDEEEGEEESTTEEGSTETDESTDAENDAGEEGSRRRDFNDDEMQLPSGKVIGNKSSNAHRSRPKRAQNLSTHPEAEDETISTPAPDHERRRTHSSSPPLTEAYLISTLEELRPQRQHNSLAKRDAQGIVGLSDHERKALRATEKKMIKMETRAKQNFEAGVEARGNVQLRYRIGGSRGGKKMGGLEKRLG